MKLNKRYLGTSLAPDDPSSVLTYHRDDPCFVNYRWDEIIRTGQRCQNLILLGIAFFGSALIGICVGYFFARVSNYKPDSAWERYLPALIPIIYALVFAIIALSLSHGNFNSGWWGVYALKNPMLLIFGIGLSLS